MMQVFNRGGRRAHQSDGYRAEPIIKTSFSVKNGSYDCCGLRGKLRRNPKMFSCGIVFAVALILVISLTTSLPTISSLHSSPEINPLIWIVLNSTPVIDGHNDLPNTLRGLLAGNFSVNLDQDLRNVAPFATSNYSHTDITRLRQGGVGAQFWSVYVSCNFQYKNAVQETMDQIDIVKRMVALYPDAFLFATSSQDIEHGFKIGKIASLMGVEGGHSIASSLAVLRLYYELGVRYMTLSHNCNPPWVTSHLVTGTSDDKGLSDYGKIVVSEMNRLGMLVDLSHVSEMTMHDALGVTKAPIIFSHSGAYAVCNSTRNVRDDVLKKVASNGGVVMMNFYSNFVSCQDNASISQVADHIDHIKKIAGEDNVGLGADYDGVDSLPKGLEDVSRYPFLLNELLNRGWTRVQLEKLTGRNLLRVFKAVEKISEQLKQDGIQPSPARLPFEEISSRSNCSLPWN